MKTFITPWWKKIEYSRNAIFEVDFEDNRDYLYCPILVHTRFFNKELGLWPNEYACYFVKKWASSDGASIPTLWTRITGLCPRSKQMRFSSLTHDNWYKEKKAVFYKYDKMSGEIWEILGELKITRNMADRNIAYEMEKWGASIFDRVEVYLWLYFWWQKARDSYLIS